MVYCGNCGKEISEQFAYCPFCGKSTIESENENTDSAFRNIKFDGTIYKCPNCGETLPSFSSTCSSCGYEIRDTKNTKSISELFEILQSNASNDAKILSVKTFPIPNSREDILEFMFLAVSNFDAEYYATHLREDSLSAAWMSKIELCYKKAKIVLKDTTELSELTAIYNDTLYKVKRVRYNKILFKLFGVALVVWGLCLISLLPESSVAVFIGLALFGIGTFMILKRIRKKHKEMN